MPTPLWQLVLLDEQRPPSARAEAASWARRILDLACLELEGPHLDADSDDVLDVWSCLGAALLSREVAPVLGAALRPDDLHTLERLGDLLAEPAASLCREAARVVAA